MLHGHFFQWELTRHGVIAMFQHDYLSYFFLLGIAANWMRLRTLSEESNNITIYWFADAFHLTTIIVFSIAASQKNIPWLVYSLEAIFFIAIAGHLVGAWVKQDNEQHWDERLWLAGANLLGIIVIMARPILKIGEQSILPVALASTLIAWYTVRKYILQQDGG
jgi:hypothetical protein